MLTQVVDEPKGILKIQKLKRSTKKIVMEDGSIYVFKAGSEERKGFCVPSGKRYLREIVASEIAQVLGLNQVPNTRLAKVEGKIGALQCWIKGSKEFKKLQKVERGKAIIKLPKDTKVITASFDFLIGNTDRHRDNYFITDGDQLHLIDHGLSLHTKSDKGKLGRLVNASKSIIIPSEVKDWVNHWQMIKGIAYRYGIPNNYISAMHLRLIALWNSKTLGQAVESVRVNRPSKSKSSSNKER